MHVVERLIRRVAMGVIAIFAIALVAFVLAMLVDDRDMLLRFYGGKRLLEILVGPVVAFVTLMIIIVRARKDADAGGSRSSFIALLTFGVALVSGMPGGTAAKRGSQEQKSDFRTHRGILPEEAAVHSLNPGEATVAAAPPRPGAGAAGTDAGPLWPV